MRIVEITLLVSLLAGGAQAASYTVIDLGVAPGANGSAATALNNLGQVAGYNVSAGWITAFLWDPQTGMRDLGSVPGQTDLSMPFGLNDRGQVAGQASTASAYTSWVWDAATGMTDIGSPVGYEDSAALALNAQGQVVGQFWGGNPFQIGGYVWDPSTGMQVLPLPPGMSDNTATDINDFGQIVGWADATAGFWDADGSFTDLGALLGPDSASSEAAAINNLGQVAVNNYHAGSPVSSLALWDALTGMTDLGVMPGYAFTFAVDINNAGQILGYALDETWSQGAAFLWDKASGFVDLSTLIDPLSGWNLAEALQINDLGQIAGTGWNGTDFHAVLLTPTATPVPLPATLPLVAAALGGLALVRGSRRG